MTTTTIFINKQHSTHTMSNNTKLEERLQKYIEDYEGIFTFEAPTKQLTPDDESLKLKPIEAIGKYQDIDSVLDNISSLGVESQDMHWPLNLELGHITKSFLNYYLAQRLSGLDHNGTLESSQAIFPIQGKYEVHKLKTKWEEPKRDEVFVFLDWDETIEVDKELRKNTLRFLKEMKREKLNDGRSKYNFIVTSASFDIDKKFYRYKKELLGLIDGVYSVPIIAPNPANDKSCQRTGKLYTDICQRLNIPSKQAVIITDAWNDQSPERQYPIYTLVTDSGTNADAWIDVLRFANNYGPVRIYSQLNRISENSDFPIANKHPRVNLTDAVEAYKVNDNTHMLKSVNTPYCFIVEDRPIGMTISEKSKKILNTIYASLI